MAGNGTSGNDMADAGTAPAADNGGAARDGTDVLVPMAPVGEISFAPVLEKRQQGSSINSALRNGEPVPLNSTDWPASFITEFHTVDGPASCTSAMIGPGILLTAAHCIPEDHKTSFSFAGTAFDLTCVRHPKWESGEDPSADYGLCVIANPAQRFTPPRGFLYETVDPAPMSRVVRSQVVLTGYGCISDKVADGRVDGRYRIGKNVIVATSDTPQRSYAPNYYGPTGQRNNLFTADTGANICPGDSGGPAFSAGAPNSSGYIPRKIIGVNSRVFYDKANRQKYGASLISSVGSADFGTWARAWLNSRRLAACGLTGAPTGCRS